MKYLAKSENGFSLIELILVLVLLGILLGFTINSTGVLHNYRLRIATEELLSYLRKAQHLAIINQKVYQIEFSSEEKYRLINKGNVLSENILGAEIKLEHNFADYINFYPLGTASAGTITLTNNRGNKQKIIISVAGRIRVDI